MESGSDTDWLLIRSKVFFRMNGVPDLHDTYQFLYQMKNYLEKEKRLNDVTHTFS